MSIIDSVGIMQGRLSPPIKERLQFFPKDWVAEFIIAKNLGFSHIEWFLDRDNEEIDPIKDIWSNPEVWEKIDYSSKILPISSIDCGKCPLFGQEKFTSLSNFKILLPILQKRLQTGVVTIPLLEDSAPRTVQQKNETWDTLNEIIPIVTILGLRIALETEMVSTELIDFVDSFNSPKIGVCYDIGNAVSYGVDAPMEIRQLGARIFEVHGKDRRIGTSQSVLLGSGAADFDGCLKALAEIKYQGIFTLQCWRGVDYLGDAQKQLSFFVNKLRKYF